MDFRDAPAFDRLADRLYLGRAPGSADVPALRAAGITHLLDVRMTDEWPRLSSDAGFAHFANPTDDDFRPKGASWFFAGHLFAQVVLVHGKGTLLVHCAQGRNRSPAMAYAILRTVYGCTMEEAAVRIMRRSIASNAYVPDAERFAQTFQTQPRPTVLGRSPRAVLAL